MRAFNNLGSTKQFLMNFSEKEEGEGGGLKILVDRADIGCISTKSI